MTKLPALEKLAQQFGGKLDWKNAKNLGPAWQFVEDTNGWYSNKKGSPHVYLQPKQPADALARCYGCETLIEMVPVTVNNWANDGPGPCAGVDVTTEYVKYCPTCEKPPKSTAIRHV